MAEGEGRGWRGGATQGGSLEEEFGHAARGVTGDARPATEGGDGWVPVREELLLVAGIVREKYKDILVLMKLLYFLIYKLNIYMI